MSVFTRIVRKPLAAVSTLVALSAIALATAGAQAAPAAPAANALKVGDMAPDFTVTTVTSAGVESRKFKLSEHRGETVVLAFFPKARTSGCTTQMEAYRDQYAQVFMGGKKVSLIGVSIDSDTALISWAQDAKFPFRFGSDVDAAVGTAYGANNAPGRGHKRHLYVIDPKGKIAYINTPFLQMSADAYSTLGTAIAQAGNAK
ncbi:MAG: redoxin domain-containing protein [Gemmatimonadaceae bacterium]|nr:redoxin domain-containing protein [Gemmatimonadaceae bacterium]